MLDRLMSLIPPRAIAALRSVATWLPGQATPSAPTILPGLDTRPAPMRPLRPPAATNDNPLRAIHEAVERELRAGGHLR